MRTSVLSTLIGICLVYSTGCKKEEPSTPNTSTVFVVDTVSVPLGMVADVDGHVYATTVIGGKRWMAENLKTAHYTNGDPVPYMPTNSTWEDLTTGAWSNYAQDASYDILYGKLYNWHTVIDPRNVCPTGWHVPTDLEWQSLEVALGMQGSESEGLGVRGTAANVGGQLKAVSLWDSPNTGADNSSGFSGYGGGGRSNSGSYFAIGTQGNWWSSTTLDSTQAYQRRLSNTMAGISRFGALKSFGNSVRCVQN